MATKDDWTAGGLEVLAEQGLPGVRIDRIAARLGVSKGSFHHHFDGAAAYRRALLLRYEEQVTGALHEVAGHSHGLQRLSDLLDSFDELYDAHLETALRAWAIHDADARAVTSRVDQARLQVLQEAWSSLLPHADAARTAALVPHLIIIGASASPSTVSPQELRSVLELLERLAPQVPQVSVEQPPQN